MTLRPRVLAAVAALPLLLAACGGSPSATAAGSGGPVEPAAAARTLTVVASTDVWGSVVGAIAGPGVEVRSIITSPDADPHSYESTPADAAALSRADLVVWNGGGYDPFVEQSLQADPGAAGRSVQAFALRADPADENEHVWFDPGAVKNVVTQVAERLAAVEPAQADALRGRAAAFTAQVDAEAARLAAIGAARPGAQVFSTEPIAHHLLRSAGVTDVTPPAFVDAVEAGNEPPAAALVQVRDALAARGPAALVFNPQTETPITEQLRTTATTAGVPVVNVTETLPTGVAYLPWLDGNRVALARALGLPA